MDNQPAEGKKKFKPGGCSLADVKKKKAKGGARLVLASREEDSGRKIQTSRGERGGRLDRFRVRLFPLSFFCIFSFKIAPPCASVENSYL